MKFHDPIFGNPTKQETMLIHKIAKRMLDHVAEMCIDYDDLTTIEMDVTACHAHCPLKLDELLQAPDFDFIHDLGGIRNCLNRKTGELEHCFLPRYAKPEEPTICVCVGCGCTDDAACLDDKGNACHWLEYDLDKKIGVCSECQLAQWHAITKPGPRQPHFEIVENTDHCVVIRDLGPWDRHPTVTNAVEKVVEVLAPMLRGRRLEYYDSDGNRDQILVRDGKYDRFAPAGVAA